MTLNKGWLNRQFARASKDVQGWPSWMKREAGFDAPTAERQTSQDQRQAAPETTSPNSERVDP